MLFQEFFDAFIAFVTGVGASIQYGLEEIIEGLGRLLGLFG